MIGDTYHDLETTIYDRSCLCIPLIDGLSAPSNTDVDVSVTNGICIYLHLTSSTGPDAEQIQGVTVLPIITPQGLTYGGQLAPFSAKVLPKILLGGYIDTPCTQLGEYFVSQVIDSNGIRYMYPEIIAMMVEGRANFSTSMGWERLDPLWYRDPYGRVYNEPRILDFTGNYMEGVPERVQFTMTLKVT